MPNEIFPHGPLQELAEGVWSVRGISSIPVHRNMIVVRAPDGGLILHSVVALDEAGRRTLAAVGPASLAIVPSLSHQLDASAYHRAFPDLPFACPASIRADVAKNVPVAATVEDVLPPMGWKLHHVPGVKIDEYVYEVPLAGGGKMLMVNDVFGHANAAEGSLRGRLMGAAAFGLGDRFGIPRIIRWRSVSDLKALKRFAGELAAIPGLKLITVSHGDPVTRDAAAQLRALAA